jgi:DNA-binding transcriptional MerR regulator
MNRQDDKLTIQQVADATGLSVYTLRYYERIGLIHLIDRAENRHRRYSIYDLDWIEFLTKLRTTGMSIQQMLSYAELQRHGFGPPDQFRRKNGMLTNWCTELGRDPAEIERTVAIAPLNELDQLDAYVAAGATHIIFGLDAPFDLAPVEKLVEWRDTWRG